MRRDAPPLCEGVGLDGQCRPIRLDGNVDVSDNSRCSVGFSPRFPGNNASVWAKAHTTETFVGYVNVQGLGSMCEPLMFTENQEPPVGLCLAARDLREYLNRRNAKWPRQTPRCATTVRQSPQERFGRLNEALVVRYDPRPNCLLKNADRDGGVPAEPHETTGFPDSEGSAGASPFLF